MFQQFARIAGGVWIKITIILSEHAKQRIIDRVTRENGTLTGFLKLYPTGELSSWKQNKRQEIVLLQGGFCVPLRKLEDNSGRYVGTTLLFSTNNIFKTPTEVEIEWIS